MFVFLMICKFCAKNSIFTNKVNKRSHCAGFVDSFGGCLPRLCEMHHDAHVTFFNCCCSEGRAAKGHVLASHGTLLDAAVGTFPMLCGSKVLGQVPISRACIPKKNAMQLFNLWRLFCPEMQSCMERKLFVCRHTDHLFGDRNGRRRIQRDTQGYIGIHVYPGVSRCIPSPGYTGIHWDTRVSRCIPVYPLTRIHRDTLGYTCIPMYPGVSPHQQKQGYIGIHVYPNVSWCIPVCLLIRPYHQVFFSMADT